jgi:hypothetical protein
MDFQMGNKSTGLGVCVQYHSWSLGIGHFEDGGYFSQNCLRAASCSTAVGIIFFTSIVLISVVVVIFFFPPGSFAAVFFLGGAQLL